MSSTYSKMQYHSDESSDSDNSRDNNRFRQEINSHEFISQSVYGLQEK